MSTPEMETDLRPQDTANPYQTPSQGAAATPHDRARKLVDRVRHVAMAEGVSWLLLLAALPLKYQFGIPAGVKIMGPIHGALFVLLLIVLFQAWGDKALSFGKSVLVFFASLIPFGPVLIDRKLVERDPGES